MAETLHVTIRGFLHQDPESGFAVMSAYRNDSGEPVKIVAEVAAVEVGDRVEVTGVWERHPKFGPQFKASTVLPFRPTGADEIRSYLEAGHVKGIRGGLAKRLIERFGDDLFRILDEEPERLRELSGIGARKLETIRRSWHEQHGLRNVMVFLSAHGVSAARAFLIHKHYGERSVEVIRRDPYRLASDVRGIGFEFADKVARTLGHDARSPFRLLAGFRHVLDAARGKGHCGMPVGDAEKEMLALLGVEAELIAATIENAVTSRLAIAEEIDGRRILFEPSLHRAEERIAKRLASLAEEKPGWSDIDPEDAIRAAEEESGIALDATQRGAIELALTSRAIVITGGPGVGKTTLVRALVAMFEAAELDVSLAAPTGRAAKRLAESTARPASTIHRLLEMSPQSNEFQRDEEATLEADVVIVDEASMVDVPLLDAVLRALPRGAAIVLVGDADQLPSIGPGQVLHDILASGRVPSIRLTEIHRQTAGSRIIVNAHRINRGQMPEWGKPGEETDMFLFPTRDPARAAGHIVELVTTKIPARFGFRALREVQVLAPMRRGAVGIDALNARLQEALNPASRHRTGVERPNGVVFRPRDKVMQTENNYDKNVFNGDVGVIATIDGEKETFSVDFGADAIVDYAFDEAHQLTLAYATTIHKSQGSEYEAVVIALMPEHHVMLQRNLFYTAVTRGRKLVVVVGNEDSVRTAVRTGRAGERITRLAHRLRHAVTKAPPA
jgi:exodeoxyribonuclease V alpha subunit